jgi:putative resolvase
VTDKLIGNMVQVLSSVCTRLSRRQSARNRALKAVRCAQRDLGPMGVAVGGDGDRVLG